MKLLTIKHEYARRDLYDLDKIDKLGAPTIVKEVQRTNNNFVGSSPDVLYSLEEKLIQVLSRFVSLGTDNKAGSI